MIVILLAILLLTVYDYKRAVLVTASSLMLMPQWSSGLSGVKLSYIVILFQCLYYFVWIYSNEKKICHDSYSMWIWIPCAMASIGYILSNQFGDVHNLPITIVNVVNYFVYPYIVFKLISRKKDLLFYVKSMFVFFFIVEGYAVIEAILHNNFISEFSKNHGLTDGIMGTETVGERFGFARCSSILSYSSALGMTSAITFFLFLYLTSKGYHFGIIKKILLLILLPFGVLLSGTRSQMFVFAICLIPFLFYRSFIKTDTYKLLISFGCIIAFSLGSMFIVIIDSIIHSDKAAVGSSSDMRMEQLDICLYYLHSAPWFGHGKNYIWEYVRPYNPALYGAESVWFPTMVDYGLVGCFTYLLIIIGLIVWLYKFDKILCFLPLAFLVGKSVSIVIGIELNYVIITSIVLIKTTQFLRHEDILFTIRRLVNLSHIREVMIFRKK